MMIVPTCAFGTGDGLDKPTDKPSEGDDAETETTVSYNYVEFGSYPQEASTPTARAVECVLPCIWIQINQVMRKESVRVA